MVVFFTDLLNREYGGNSVYLYLLCFFLFLAGVILTKVVLKYVIKNAKVIAEKTATTIDDFVLDLAEHVGVPVGYLISFYFSLRVLSIPEKLDKVLTVIVGAFVTFVAAKFLVMFLDYILKVYLAKEDNIALERSFSGIIRVIKFVVWVIAVTVFLDNIGIKISAVVAGLGIGGVAVALAAQAILGDLFSYISILFDKPFKVGDFIIIDNYMGVVDNIGIKTTRISSLSGEQLVFSNSDLTSARVRNYKLMQKRRVVFKLGVTYDTPLEKLKKISGIIKDVVESTENTQFDRAHFFEYGDFALIFEVVYYVTTGDYNKYMDAQQTINFSIKERFEELGVEFAYPTQTLYIYKSGV